MGAMDYLLTRADRLQLFFFHLIFFTMFRCRDAPSWIEAGHVSSGDDECQLVRTL